MINNNKGFAISGVIYAILILFIMIMFGILTLLGTRKVVFDKLKHDIAIKLNEDENIIRNLKMDKSGASKPNLTSNMIPIIYDENQSAWVKADNRNEYVQSWYNYDEKNWANAVTVTESTRENYLNAPAGTKILEADILTYLVWVPRYRYKIFNDGTNISVGTLSPSSVHTIDIVFENKSNIKSNGTTTGDYLTHPAFTFGDEELNGFWVGKFETTGTTNNVTIKPNLTSLRNINVSAMFTASINMKNDGNIYGINTTEVDTHMMKNMEWGAVAYLSHSKYGINGDIRYNNSQNYITGCAATNNPTTGHATPGYAGCESTYNTSTGHLASTTGNITGIYDMAGGAWEYVMGVIEDSLGSNTPTSGRNALNNSGFNGKFTCPTCDSQTDLSLTTGINFPDQKYYDLYTYGTTFNNLEAYTRGKLGDVTKEMGNFAISIKETDSQTRYVNSWYNDFSHFSIADYPYFSRGGNWACGIGSGIFAFYNSSGKTNNDNSFRVVMAIYNK